MAGKSQIAEIGQTVGWKGTPAHRTAEPSTVRTLPVIDNSNRYASNVRTSVDCYVSGQYVQRNGRVLEVTQRYTIFVAYSKETQLSTMNQVRDRVLSDFQAKYGGTFNVINVQVPQLPVPRSEQIPGVPPDKDAMQLYGGSELFQDEMIRGTPNRIFREMTKYEKLRYDVGTERAKAKTNIESIRKRYKLGR